MRTHDHVGSIDSNSQIEYTLFSQLEKQVFYLLIDQVYYYFLNYDQLLKMGFPRKTQ